MIKWNYDEIALLGVLDLFFSLYGGDGLNNFEFKVCSSLEKVFPDMVTRCNIDASNASEKAPRIHSEKLRLSGLRGERVSFQVAYRSPGLWGRSWGRMQVDSPEAVEFTIYRVCYVPGSIPANYKTDDGYITTESGLFPDLLEPIEEERLPLVPGIWQSLWIEMRISEAGIYPVHIAIESLDGKRLGLGKVMLEIINAELPALHIPHTRWFHSDCLAEYYNIDVFSEAYWGIVENFISYAVEHGINAILTPVFTPPIDTEVGGERLTVQLVEVEAEVEAEVEGASGCEKKYSFGFERLERWVKMCQNVGVTYFEISHLFTQWGARHAPKIMGKQEGRYVKLFGWETEASGVEYQNFLQQLLPALTAKLEELGIADRTFFHVSDEPVLTDLEQYTNVRNIIAPYLSSYKIVDALTDYEFYTTGAVSTPIPAVDHIAPFIESVNKGELSELWCYFCCVQSYKVPNQFLMQPSYRNRILGTLLYKYNIAGFLHWGYNFYNCIHSVYPINPFLVTDADGTFPSGDAFVVYPGADGKPLASLRLKVMRDAFDDLRALKLLEELKSRDFVMGLIDGNLMDPIAFDCFPQSEEYLLDLRSRVNQEIQKEIKSFG